MLSFFVACAGGSTASDDSSQDDGGAAAAPDSGTPPSGSDAAPAGTDSGTAPPPGGDSGTQPSALPLHPLANCTYPTNATPSQLNAVYATWKAKMLTSSGAPSGAMRVQDLQTGMRTISEGIGYGMLITLYMNDRTLFDSLWAYAQAHFDGNHLMNWEIDSSGNTQGTGSATDADEDMAWALIMADKQWGGSYLAAAKALLGNMTADLSGTSLKLGDSSGSSTTTHVDYFAPAYYRLFATVTGNSAWTSLIAPGYNLIRQVRNASTGLVPDACTFSGGATGIAADAMYGYDACRTPWRVGLDWCLNASTDAQGILTPMVTYAASVGATMFKGPIPISGGTGQFASGAFTGPFGVAAMNASANQQFINDSWHYTYQVVSSDMNYFSDSLGIVSLLVMSGNFWDLTK